MWVQPVLYALFSAQYIRDWPTFCSGITDPYLSADSHKSTQNRIINFTATLQPSWLLFPSLSSPPSGEDPTEANPVSFFILLW